MPSAYKLMIGLAVIIVLSLVWIPVYEVFGTSGGLVDSFNNATTDSDVIEYNETSRQIMFYSLLVIILIIFVWIIKEDRNEFVLAQ